MPENTSIATDPASVLAYVFGAAVIVPSMIALGLTLLAVGRMLL